MNKIRLDLFLMIVAIFGFNIFRQILEKWIDGKFALLISLFVFMNIIFFVAPNDNWFLSKLGKGIKRFFLFNVIVAATYGILLLLGELFFRAATQIPEWINYVLFFFMLLIFIGYGFHLVGKTTQE